MKNKSLRSALKNMVAGVSFGVICSLAAMPVQAMTLEEAVKVSIESHPTIQAAEAALRASKAEVSEAIGGYLPSIDFNGDMGYQNSKPSVTADSKSTFRRAGELSLSQTLFNGFETANNVEAAGWRHKVSGFDLVDAREEIALRTIQSYLDVYRNRIVVKMAQKNVDLHNKIFSNVERRVNGGQSDHADLNQARSRLALAKARLRQMQGDMVESEARFLEVVGSPADELYASKARAELLPNDLEEALRLAKEKNPQIQSAKAFSNSRQSEVEAADASFMPNVGLELSESRDWDANGYEGITSDRKALVTLSYNLYNGGSDLARKRVALENASEARALEAQTERAIDRQTRIAYNAFLTAAERLAYLQDRTTASSDAVQSYWKQYDIGSRTLLDVLDVENELFQSMVAHSDGEVAYLFTQYQVFAAMGELVNIFSGK